MKEVQRRARKLLEIRLQEKSAEEGLRVELHSSLGAGEAKSVAETLGISPQHLSDIRKGNRGISSELLDKLCEVEG
jgi:transcriptional regulator with XRE-family HTH domain